MSNAGPNQRGPIGRPLLRLDEVGSTMDIARKLIVHGAPPGTAVLAGHQSAGVGRASRRWETPPWSAILVTVITDCQRPPSELGVLSLLWGWAVAETIESFTDRPASIKWPNDVLVDGKKIAGILTTNVHSPHGPRQSTGIGLNVSATDDQLPETATSLAILSGAALLLDDVLQVLFANLDRALVLADDAGTDYLARLVQPRLAFSGERVSVQDGERLTTGTLAGIDPDGALCLRLESGDLSRIVVGDLTRGPRRA